MSGLFIGSSQAHGSAQSKPTLSLQDREDLILMFTQLLDEIETPVAQENKDRNDWWYWDSPFSRLERAIKELEARSGKIQKNIEKIRSHDMQRLHEGLLVIIQELHTRFDQVMETLQNQGENHNQENWVILTAQINGIAVSVADLAERFYQLELRSMYPYSKKFYFYRVTQK